VDSLARVLEEAVGSPAQRAHFGTAGRARFQAQFTFDGMIDRYRGIYRQLLAAPAV
jgi:glycosyltransferase involved in cell wall biosynthesis